MKRKFFLVDLVLLITIFLVGCSGNGGPIPPINQNQSPIASFTANPTSGVAPLEVSFNGSNSSDSDGSIVSYAWDFKDGYTGNGVTVNHTFSSAGSYNVGLTITDNKGATDLDTKTIIVTTPEPTPEPVPEPIPETIFPSREEAMEIIKANAYDYWGDDYVMVQWEIDRQTEAYDWLVKQTEYPNIMSNAYDYWGDDYVMVQWEYERQVEAYEGLQ
ncbi:PKD domain-containing protein [Candidatus Atribacteria bacterium 1244-E10-H5-B2]|nr:MAG: PKD domain-containing protein [Candidatus Atribacteria bacterium 1244-E10-H5-B2]